MAARSYLSIGQVLDLLKQEFPDLTISKIRFLESQGLLDPERTPSGYRKFYEPDIDRLRFILRAQSEHYLPLKVIRGRLGSEPDDMDEGGAAPEAPEAPEASAADAGGSPGAGGPESGPGRSAADVAVAEVVVSAGSPDGAPNRAVSGRGAQGPSGRDASAARLELLGRGTNGRSSARQEDGPAVVPEDDGEERADSVSLTLDELAEASGLSHAEVTELERFGLVTGRRIAGTTYYDGDSLEIACVAAGFQRFGVEARHLRMYKTAVEREAGFFEQVVTPMLKQRNPQARRQAIETLLQLSRLGNQLRAAALRQALREYTGGS